MLFLKSPEMRKPGFKLALFGTVLAIFVLGLGAFTRLVDAGLGCPDWPGCYGHVLWPETASEVQLANQAFPETPVEAEKTWPEMVHRYFASALGFISILLVWLSVKYRHATAQPMKQPLFMLAFIILQGMFGMWTVTLKLWPQVVTAHLLGGFATFSLYWLLTLRLSQQTWQLPIKSLQQITALRRWAVLALMIVSAQVALGGWTTSNYAAVACPDLPTCQAQWLPDMDFSAGFDIFQHIGPNYLGGTMDNDARIAIHFSHRIGAIITMLYLLLLSYFLFKKIAVAETQRMAKIITAMLLLQVLLGLANIVFNFPLVVAVAHNLGGAFLLLTIVTLNYHLFSCRLQTTKR